VLGIPRLLERLVKLLGGSNDPGSPSTGQLSFAELLAMHFYQSTRSTPQEDDEEEEEEGEGEDGEEEEMMEDVAEDAGRAPQRGAMGAAGIAGLAGVLGNVLGGMGRVGGVGMIGGGGAGGIGGADERMLDQELEALMDGTAQTLKALALSTYQVCPLFLLFFFLLFLHLFYLSRNRYQMDSYCSFSVSFSSPSFVTLLCTGGIAFRSVCAPCGQA
jgi:hypothetical protein